MNIREATLQDVTMLVELCRKSFYDAWTIYNSDDDIYAYMNEVFTEEKIKSEIENKDESYYVALVDNIPSGYVKLRRNYKEGNLGEVKAVELQRIYIHQHLTGKKIGQTLIQYAIDVATKEGFEVIWLGVWEKNTRAMDLYKRFGFEIYDEHFFKMGNDISHDWLMKKMLL